MAQQHIVTAKQYFQPTKITPIYISQTAIISAFLILKVPTKYLHVHKYSQTLHQILNTVQYEFKRTERMQNILEWRQNMVMGIMLQFTNYEYSEVRS